MTELKLLLNEEANYEVVFYFEGRNSIEKVKLVESNEDSIKNELFSLDGYSTDIATQLLFAAFEFEGELTVREMRKKAHTEGINYHDLQEGQRDRKKELISESETAQRLKNLVVDHFERVAKERNERATKQAKSTAEFMRNN